MPRNFMVYMIFVVCLFLLTGGSVHSEFYRFKDAQGNIVFTDDITQIPENQRPDMKTFESVTTSESQKPAAPKDTKIEPEIKPEPSEVNDEALDALKNWLIREKKSLDREKAELEAMKPDINTPEDQETYNNKAITINKRIDVYKEKRKTYQKMLQEME